MAKSQLYFGISPEHVVSILTMYANDKMIDATRYQATISLDKADGSALVTVTRKRAPRKAKPKIAPVPKAAA